MADFIARLKDENIVEYTKSLARKLPKKFRRHIDDQLTARTGADACVIWDMGGKIYLTKTLVSEETVALELAGAVIYPGYSQERQLYALDGKIYVEDDYVWTELPDMNGSAGDGDLYDAIAAVIAEYAGIQSAGSASEVTGGDSADETNDGADDETDNDADDDEKAADDASYENELATTYLSEEDAASKNAEVFWLNFFTEDQSFGENAKFEPLIVDSFDLKNPVLKIEVAYRNALCEAASYPSCGWIVLMHGGHFYVPVESIYDPVNRETYYFVKIINSYPTNMYASNFYTAVQADVFAQCYSIPIRYRAGYCINWRRYFFENVLPDNYLDAIPDFYSFADQIFNPDSESLGYDGLDCEFHEDIDDYEADDASDEGSDGGFDDGLDDKPKGGPGRKK